MSQTVIHLVRHGQVHNPQHIFYGRLPGFRLSEKGREQSRAAGRYLSGFPIEAVFTSPMLRARQTGREILACFPGLKLQTSKLINEVCTVYEGLPSDQVDRRDGGDIYTGLDACYEQPADVFRRVAVFFRRLKNRHSGRHAAAVTHGDVITFAVLWALGWEVAPQNKRRLRQAGYAVPYPAHASVTSLAFETGSAQQRPTVSYAQPWR